jgi:hypothetical protein
LGSELWDFICDAFYEVMVGENENMIYLCKDGIFPMMLLKMLMEIGNIVVILLDWMSLSYACYEIVWKPFMHV